MKLKVGDATGKITSLNTNRNNDALSMFFFVMIRYLLCRSFHIITQCIERVLKFYFESKRLLIIREIRNLLSVMKKCLNQGPGVTILPAKSSTGNKFRIPRQCFSYFARPTATGYYCRSNTLLKYVKNITFSVGTASTFYHQNRRVVLDIVTPIAQEIAVEFAQQIGNNILKTILYDEILPKELS